MVGLCDSFCSVDILDREALGISNVVRKAILFFPPPLLVCMPAELLQSFLEQLTQLTCRFAEGAAQEESVSISILVQSYINCSAFISCSSIITLVSNKSVLSLSPQSFLFIYCQLFHVLLSLFLVFN